ncbi:MAG: hypothetical protein QOG65_1002, partial [Actinomycetota bacterium]|nr:hypothetical protein [Actinomycetota bacterium]
AEIRLAAFDVGNTLPLGIGKLTMGDQVKLDIDAQFLPH